MHNSNELTIETIAEGLTLMACSLRGQDPEKLGGAMGAVWLAAMTRNQIGRREFMDRAVYLADTGQFFPAVGEFLKPLLESRPSFAVIQDPVELHTGEIASRKTAQKNELPYFDPESANPALPTPEQRALAAKRLDDVESVVTKAKTQRKKAIDVLAESKALPAPASVSEIEKKREAMRKQAGVA